MDTGNKPVLSRRAALRGAAIGAAMVWVPPAVQVISMTTANAASAPPSGVKQSPPRGPGNNRGQGSNRGRGHSQGKARGPKKAPPRKGWSR